MELIPKELMSRSMNAKGELTLTRHELQEIVILTSNLTTQLEVILTSKNNYLFSCFGITS